jgi:hypothetical protein
MESREILRFAQSDKQKNYFRGLFSPCASSFRTSHWSLIGSHEMKSTLHIALLVVALIAIALVADAWRSARHDTAQLNSTLATQNAALQQAAALEKQRDTQLAIALAAIESQKRAIQTPQQAAQAIPTVLPPLPLPVSIQLPTLSPPIKPDQAPPAELSIPQADLKPLYDDLQDCRADTQENDTVKKDLANEQARTAALTRERDTAIAAAKGGTFWLRLKRSAKWFAIGVAAGATAAALAHH